MYIYFFFFFSSWHTLLECCCVHHWSLGLPTGCLLPCRREADIHSVASIQPQWHVARCGWVFLSVASSPTEAFGLLMRLNGDDLHLVNCGWCSQRGAILAVGDYKRGEHKLIHSFFRLWYEKEAGNQRRVGLLYWSYVYLLPIENLPKV